MSVIMIKLSIVLCLCCISIGFSDIYAMQETQEVTEIDQQKDRVPEQVVEQLAALRRAQQQSWGYDFFELEAVIKQLKERYNKLYTTEMRAGLQAVPLISMQILFLILWWIFVFYVKLITVPKRIILLFLLVLTATTTVLSMKKYDRAVVMRTIPVYIGPDISYPVKTVLYPLDEVTVIKQVQSWYYSATPVCGWIQAEAVIKI